MGPFMPELTIVTSRLQHIYHGRPYARVDFNHVPESTLVPSQYT